MAQDIFIARQPILDQDLNTFGYELLYRDGPENATFFDDPDQATLAVIERTYLHWGLERLIGDRFGMINASASLVVNGLHHALPPEGIIIELRENSLYDGVTVDALARARREGYHFALDNVRSLAQLESSRALTHCSIVKVELSTVSHNEMLAIVEFIRREHPAMSIVAEKVQTHAQHARAMAAGFDLFQGYLFAQPEILQRKARPANASAVFALLAEIQREDIDIARVEQIVGSDPTLAYCLLRVVNSSAFGLDRRVDSLRHAIVLLGVNQVRHLTTLLALSASHEGAEELLALGATRARLASLLADGTGIQSAAFTVGLLSVTDVLYQTSMEELINDLPVSHEIGSALIDGSGRLGLLLEVVKACEMADYDRLRELWPHPIDEVRAAYVEATRWSDELRAQIINRPVAKAKSRFGSAPRPLLQASGRA